jgi:hypothetical protein
MITTIKIPVSIGELLDKITILQIKKQMITNDDKLNVVKKELKQLMKIGKDYLDKSELLIIYNKLMIINKNLWDVEDELRKMEVDKRFDDEFIHKARSVYFLNDERYNLKREINELTGSEINEVKQYVNYK